MSTIQFAGIAIAAVILIVLVISLIITRRKDTGGSQQRQPEAPVTEDTGSLFDEAPRDELHMLGKRDVAAPQPAWQPPAAAAVSEEESQIGPVGSAEAAAESAEEPTEDIPAVQPAVVVTETPPTPPFYAVIEAAPIAEAATPVFEGATPIARDAVPMAEEAEPVVEDAAPPAGQEASAAEQSVGDQPEAPTTEASPVEGTTEDEAAGQPRIVRLADIIVTTNEQQVDLADPDVRRMLKDLVQDEIDLAAQYRELGQNIDAVLQLTEAQRICHALDMTSHARLIQQMIDELQ
jgi:hypothetical protein